MYALEYKLGVLNNLIFSYFSVFECFILHEEPRNLFHFKKKQKKFSHGRIQKKKIALS